MVLVPNQASLSISMSCVLFPLKWFELITSLEKLGFTINQEVPYPIPPGRVTGSGHIGRKAKTILLVNSGDKSLRMIDITIENANDELECLLENIRQDHGLDIEKYIEYWQMTASHNYSIGKSAFNALSSSCKISNVDRFSEILGIEVSPFALRLGQSEAVTNSANWFDIKITPDVERDDGFNIETVYRNTDKEIFSNFISTYEDKVTKLLKQIEG